MFGWSIKILSKHVTTSRVTLKNRQRDHYFQRSRNRGGEGISKRRKQRRTSVRKMPRKWGRGEKTEKGKARKTTVEINQRKSEGGLRSSVQPPPVQRECVHTLK